MSRVLIVAIGSRGDVAPLTGVGTALRAAGHDVAIAAFTPFAAMITACGLRHLDVPAHPSDPDDADVEPGKALARFVSPAGMRALGFDILTAVADEDPDVILLSPFAEMAGHPLAEAANIPALAVRLQPLSATAQHPPSILGAWSAGPTGNRAAAHAGSWLVDHLYAGVVADLRRHLGLHRTNPRRLRARRAMTNSPILHGYSELIAPRPADWRPGMDVVGYWWPAHGGDWSPSAELESFLAAGPLPLFVGFGSTITTAARAKRLSEVIAAAARRARARVIVQAGWAGLHAGDDSTITVDDVPHDWLFPRVGAVAHHCGAGTTAAGIRAGVSTIALPGQGDGPFWAARLTALGVSAATIPQRHLNVGQLADAMHTALHDDEIRSRCRDLGRRLTGEDGAARVVTAIDHVLNRSR